jgi:hypothetical protein
MNKQKTYKITAMLYASCTIVENELGGRDVVSAVFIESPNAAQQEKAKKV